MRAFKIAHAAGADSGQVLDDCLEHFHPASATGVGLVFATAGFDAPASGLIPRLRQATGIDQWLGSVAPAICASSREYYDQPALVLMHMELPVGQVHVLDGDHPLAGLPPKGYQELAGGLGLLFVDPARSDATDWIGTIDAAVPDTVLIGGLGQPADGHREAGLRGHGGLLMGPDCPMLADHTQGCSLIGQPHTVTRSFRNIVVELDDRPALQVLEQEIGEVLARDLQRALGYIFAALPIPGQDLSDYQVRNIVGVDRQQQIIAIADLPQQGQRLQFARRDGNSARDDMEQMLVRLRKRAGPRTPRGGVYISCTGRGRNQFGPDSAELKMIADALGDIPLAGFYANGEIYRSRIHAYTGVLALFL